MAHPQPQGGAMAQYDGTHRLGGTTKSPTSPTIEQLLRGGEATRWSPLTSPTSGKDHEMEDDHGLHHKKSVLAKVKEKAKKWRHNLSKKKHSQDGNSTPSWGVNLEDVKEEDPEYLGAPMYESEMAPEACKETARQHPREVSAVSEKHVLPSSVKNGAEERSATANKTMAENETIMQAKERSPKTLTETVTEKLAPVYATVADATYAITSKIHSLAVSTPEPSSASAAVNPSTLKATTDITSSAPSSLTLKQTSPTATGSGIQPLPIQVPIATTTTTEGSTVASSGSGEQIWEKGVAVKEYIMQKLEPGEDEKALSQVISQAISPKKNPGDEGVIEKVKEVVTSFLHNEESQPAANNAYSQSSSRIPISTDVHEVKEENHGRVLQAN